jgi:hypothetical protein
VASRAPGPNWPAGVPFVAADMPTATPFMLHVYAAMAEAEGIAISTPTAQARMVVTRDFFCSCYCLYHRSYIYIYCQRTIKRAIEP